MWKNSSTLTGVTRTAVAAPVHTALGPLIFRLSKYRKIYIVLIWYSFNIDKIKEDLSISLSYVSIPVFLLTYIMKIFTFLRQQSLKWIIHNHVFDFSYLAFIDWTRRFHGVRRARRPQISKIGHVAIYLAERINCRFLLFSPKSMICHFESRETAHSIARLLNSFSSRSSIVSTSAFATKLLWPMLLISFLQNNYAATKSPTLTIVYVILLPYIVSALQYNRTTVLTSLISPRPLIAYTSIYALQTTPFP